MNKPTEDELAQDPSLNIQIENSWSESREAEQSEDERLLTGDFSFTDSQDFRGHSLRQDSPDKPYICPHCSYSSSVKQTLKNHMSRHTGERPYACTQCQSSFLKDRDLKRHIMIHTGERPFKCIQCSNTFTRSHHLKLHMTKHTGDKSYACT